MTMKLATPPSSPNVSPSSRRRSSSTLCCTRATSLAVPGLAHVATIKEEKTATPMAREEEDSRKKPLAEEKRKQQETRMRILSWHQFQTIRAAKAKEDLREAAPP